MVLYLPIFNYSLIVETGSLDLASAFLYSAFAALAFFLSRYITRSIAEVRKKIESVQINERNSSDFSTWHKYDMEYIDNWSLYRDIEIIIRTPLSLFKSDIKGK